MHLFESFLFGITCGLAIGPMALLILSNSASHGFLAGARIATAVFIGDAFYSTIAFTAGAAIAHVLNGHMCLFRGFAASILLFMGARLLSNTWKAYHLMKPSAHTGFWVALTIMLTSPLAMILFLGLAGQMHTHETPMHIIQNVAALCIGAGIVNFGLAFGGSMVRRWFSHPSHIQWINCVSGIGIMGFGLYGFIQAVHLM